MSVSQAHFLINYWQAMFWKCRRFANLQSVKQYCINKLQNLVVLTQWQRVHVSVRCAQSWRESHERRTHFLKTGVTIDLWVMTVWCYWNCVSYATVYFRCLSLHPWKDHPSQANRQYCLQQITFFRRTVALEKFESPHVDEWKELWGVLRVPRESGPGKQRYFTKEPTTAAVQSYLIHGY